MERPSIRCATAQVCENAYFFKRDNSHWSWIRKWRKPEGRIPRDPAAAAKRQALASFISKL